MLRRLNVVSAQHPQAGRSTQRVTRGEQQGCVSLLLRSGVVGGRTTPRELSLPHAPGDHEAVEEGNLQVRRRDWILCQAQQVSLEGTAEEETRDFCP